MLLGQNLFAAETNSPTITDLINVVAKINAKLNAGKIHEADYADNLQALDTLRTKYKGAKPEDLVQVLTVEAQLYLDVFDNPEKPLELFEQFKHDYPTVPIGGNTDEAIKSLKASVAKWKIRSALAIGTNFPDFSAQDVDGKPLSLADYKGKIVLIDFWATWCPPCRAELPYILKTYQKYHNQGFDIIGVSLDDNHQKLENFLKEKDITWQQSCDGKGWDGRLVAQFGLDMLPATFLLDGQRIIIAKNLRGDELEQAVAKALVKK